MGRGVGLPVCKSSDLVLKMEGGGGEQHFHRGVIRVSRQTAKSADISVEGGGVSAPSGTHALCLVFLSIPKWN